ncbi:T9SS type A sorting domain-containing protein [Aurantibacillus circumpalustris]|uniref:T9SS type A sorting domain-containing protein n=1 Tax=Aurantibacillus circumpalustris TaxID=3036359 RepID=UPI00295B5AB3|nr:T9SS type A sorting domain-containing protein [Aurantibacillus circumpalustris]
MKNFILFSFLFLLVRFSFSQSASDAAVQLTALVQNSPAQITLNWVGNATSTQYQVYRKLKTDVSWGAPVATPGGTTNQYIDNTVSVGINYEYRVSRTGSGYAGHGYINSGIEVPETFYRGKLILLVDSNFIGTLSAEISRLITDIEGDGWDVIRHDVLRTGSVTHIKDLIVNDYNEDTTVAVKAVFLLGHIPVPYSGNINPDGHPDHLGAWPADCYYADMDGVWTDNSVTSTTASPARTQNIPGDGKFDQSIVPSDLELQVGRVDFNGMPTFTLTEGQLLKNYLDKDHEYRMKMFVPIKQGVVDDNFGYFSSEAFAASGYKNFAPLVGSSNIIAADYFTSMTGLSFAWSFGCGGGTYTSASGIGNTANFAASNLHGVFTMLFGSYFGDWDSQNNFLKAPLAQGKILTSVWSGRPHYQFHHMGLGENIGYGVLLTQNNSGNLYFDSPTVITGRWIHNALMGDPTLRNDVVAPVSNVVATKAGFDCHISWSATTETTIAGYNIYVKNDTNTAYVKLNSLPISGTTYTDNCLLYKGVYTYMVRVLKLENVPSGTYYNMSEGIADTAYNSSTVKTHAGFLAIVNGNVLNLTNTSANATNFFWDLGNGQTNTTPSPVITYSANAPYQIMLVASNQCDQDTAYAAIYIVTVALDELSENENVIIFPNPSLGKIKVTNNKNEKFKITIYTTEGKKVAEFHEYSKEHELDLNYLGKGLFFIEIVTNEKTAVKKLILE